MLIMTFETETDTSLADKVANIGDISLPGMLDIGTSGYTNSRIRRNAIVGGYTGYAELTVRIVTICSYRQPELMVAGCISQLIMTTIYNYQVVITR